jgi:hypothetical protein
MAIKNKQTEENPPLLTRGELAVAAFALSEVYNSYLERYQEDDFGELTKEQMETSMNSIRTVFSKFDALLQATQPKEVSNEDR